MVEQVDLGLVDRERQVIADTNPSGVVGIEAHDDRSDRVAAQSRGRRFEAERLDHVDDDLADAIHAFFVHHEIVRPKTDGHLLIRHDFPEARGVDLDGQVRSLCDQRVTSTNISSLRRLCAWMARATSSLPVPLSP